MTARISAFLAALTALALTMAGPAAAQDVAAIAGQPDRATLEQWKADGVTTVVNMRTAEEMAEVDYDERAAVEALGMTYVEAPFDGAAPSPKVTQALGAALDGAEGKVALHCRSGSRAANALAALQVERGEADPDGLQSPAGDIRLMSRMLRELSPRYAEAEAAGAACATC